jgi:hypothetical protein
VNRLRQIVSQPFASVVALRIDVTLAAAINRAYQARLREPYGILDEGR